jgi:hypothetical protein
MGLLAVAIFHDLKAFFDIERLSNLVVVENDRHRYTSPRLTSILSIPIRTFRSCPILGPRLMKSDGARLSNHARVSAMGARKSLWGTGSSTNSQNVFLKVRRA